MKAIAAVCPTGSPVPISQSASTIIGGRIHRPHRDGENAEIQMYLSKLKDLVPYMPKNKKLSKLEVIQNVIDYICDLQTALESNAAGASGSSASSSSAAVAAAAVAAFDASAALAGGSEDDDEMEAATLQHPMHRQPLAVRSSPNRIHRQRRQRRPSSQLSNASTGSSSGPAASSACEQQRHNHTTERYNNNDDDWSA